MNCCDYDCHQGRDCPVRATQVAKVHRRTPGPEPLPPSLWRERLGDLAAYMLIAIVVSTACTIIVLL